MTGLLIFSHLTTAVVFTIIGLKLGLEIAARRKESAKETALLEADELQAGLERRA